MIYRENSANNIAVVSSDSNVNKANAKIPRTQPCSDEMPPRDCLAAWHELTSPLFDINVLKPEQFSGSVIAYLLGRTIFTEVDLLLKRFDALQGIPN